MAENIKNFPVNWIEGMKINKNHFIELQDNFEDTIRDSRNLVINEMNYGLLNSSLDSSFKFSVFIDTHNELSIDIKLLKAVTPGGGRIEITENTGPYIEKVELKELNKDNVFYVLLNVDPFKRIPVGKQNMEEVPPRFPYAISKYHITIALESELNQNNIGHLQMPLAKFNGTNSGFEIVKTYIPPCTIVNSHPSLIATFESYQTFFKRIEFNSVQIIQKVKFRNKTEDENVIANMVILVCEKSLSFIENQITLIKWSNYNTKPIDVIEKITSLARTLKNCLDTFSGDGKEMLFNYFSEWTDIKSGDYERLFLDTINCSLSIYDIQPTMQQSLNFLTKIDDLYSILKQMDYIGRKKDTGIFVNENVLSNEKTTSAIFSESKKDDKPSPSSPSFLAD